MQNGPRTIMDTRQRKSSASFVAQKRRGPNTLRDKPNGSQNAQRSYERYLALAQAQILAGDTVGAENYYQHAEHFFRSMSSHPGST